MDVLLVCLAAIVVIFGAVRLNRYWCDKAVGKTPQEAVPVKAIFSVKFYNPQLKVWCGEFYDEVGKFGYVTNLSAGDAAVGDRVWVTVGEFDNKAGYWRVEAERLTPVSEGVLYARVIKHDRTGWSCIYPNAKGVAIFTILYGCAPDELQVGKCYPIKITDNGSAELV